MPFRSVFIAVVIAFALILAALVINRARPKVETEQPTADLVRATGKCAECHSCFPQRRRWSSFWPSPNARIAGSGGRSWDMLSVGRRSWWG